MQTVVVAQNSQKNALHNCACQRSSGLTQADAHVMLFKLRRQIPGDFARCNSVMAR